MFNTNWSALPNTVKENLLEPFINNFMKHSEWIRWLEQEFDKYHGTIYTNTIGASCVIIFDSEQDYMFFLLKWA